ncbi:MAG: hypothetical protein ACQEQF_00095 [Bacillota bacterium]
MINIDELEIGDEVIIRNDLIEEKLYGNTIYFTKLMGKYRGSKMTVEKIDYDKEYIYLEGDEDWTWGPEMIEKICKTESFKVGDKVIINDNHKGTIFGIADEEDYYGDRYAVSYIDSEGDLLNDMFSKNSLKIIAENRFKAGDIIGTDDEYNNKKIIKYDEDRQHYLVTEILKDKLYYNKAYIEDNYYLLWRDSDE